MHQTVSAASVEPEQYSNHHEVLCADQDTINANYPSFTCQGFDEDTGHHFILDLVQGHEIDTTAEYDGDADPTRLQEWQAA